MIIPSSSSPALATSDWSAWVDRMPPGPPTLHVEGDVTLPTPGFETKLVAAAPPGTDAKELVLDLAITPRPGNWLQVVTHARASFTIESYRGTYDRVLVRQPDGTSVRLPIDTVS